MNLSTQYPKDTFGLLVVLAAALDATLRTPTSGTGTNLPVQISTSGFDFSGFIRRTGVDLVDANQLATALASQRRPQLNDALTWSSASAQNANALDSFTTIAPAVLAIGGAGYTAQMVLTTDSAVAGNVVMVPVSLPAGTGRNLQIYSGSTTGTLLETFNSLGSATTAYFSAYFDGTNWQPLESTMRIP